MARAHGHRIRSAAAALNCGCYRVRFPRRAARALIAVWRTGRPPTEHTRVHCAVRVRLWCGTTRDALLPSSLADCSTARPAHQVGGCGFEPSVVPRLTFLARGPRAHRPVEHQPTAHGARTHALRGADLVVMRDVSGRAPPRSVGRGSAARPPHQVGGCGFELSVLPHSMFLARGPRAHRPVESRPTAHGARARAPRGTDLVVVRDNSRRAPLQPHQVGGCVFKPLVTPRLTPVTRGPRAHRPVEHRPTAHGAQARALRGADLVVVRANSRRAPSQLHGRGSGARPPHQVGGCGFGPSVLPRLDSHGARPARSSPRGESADRPRSTRAALRGADLVVLRGNSRRAPRQFVGRGSPARPAHQVGGCGFGPSV